MNESDIEHIAAQFDGRTDITRGRSFATDSLMVNGKIFALFHRDGMVFKLPADRCRALVDEGAGTPFTSGGRTMKEWIVVPEDGSARWPALATDACAFVGEGSH